MRNDNMTQYQRILLIWIISMTQFCAQLQCIKNLVMHIKTTTVDLEWWTMQHFVFVIKVLGNHNAQDIPETILGVIFKQTMDPVSQHLDIIFFFLSNTNKLWCWLGCQQTKKHHGEWRRVLNYRNDTTSFLIPKLSLSACNAFTPKQPNRFRKILV